MDLKIHSALGPTVTPAVVYQHTETGHHQYGSDLLPHLAAGKTIMKQNDGVTLSINLIKGIMFIYLDKRHRGRPIN